jgi:hypothetical protein
MASTSIGGWQCKRRLTAIEDDLPDPGLLAQVVQGFACWVETVSREIDGPPNGASPAVAAACIYHEEVFRFFGKRFMSLKQPKNLIRLNERCN